MGEANNLAGRVAIVTGAGQGVGRGIALALAKRGMNIVVNGRTPEKLQNTIGALQDLGVEALAIAGSVNDPDCAQRTVAAAIDTFGRVDVLINNAHSFTPTSPLEQMPVENLRMNIESGLYGTFFFMQAVFPHMKDRGGSIVNFGSYNALEGTVGYGAYSAAKEAIRAISRTAAREWGRYRIRVNVINPAALSPAAKSYLAANPQRAEEINSRIALGYLGDPEHDIGGIAVFLTSDESQYLTGQTLNADGGQWMF